MKIDKHYSLTHAEKVLTLVKRLLAALPAKDVIDLRVWSNGREQGFWLGNNSVNKALVFAQHRSSDSITIMYGRSNQFDISTNMPDESLWKTGCISYDADSDAADFIVKILTDN